MSSIYFTSGGDLSALFYIKEHVREVEKLGYRVVSEWHSRGVQAALQQEWLRQAENELYRSVIADVIVVSGEVDLFGALVVGAARGCKQRVLVIGDEVSRENAGVRVLASFRYATWQEAMREYFLMHENKSWHQGQSETQRRVGLPQMLDSGDVPF